MSIIQGDEDMFVAINEQNQRVPAGKAERETEYFCPVCKGKVRLRIGKINAAHFSHISAECQDHWHYDMSEWHYSMQNRFPEEQREVVVKHGSEIHRADILHGNYIIEFQHSPISKDEINERNRFYTAAGFHIAWVFDVQEQFNDHQICSVPRNNNALMYEWSNPKRFLQAFPRPNEAAKNMIVFLYWIEDDGKESFGRVTWSTPSLNDDVPDFKKFIVSEYFLSSDIEEKLNIEDFFLTKNDRLTSHLKTIKHRYTKKSVRT